MSNLEIPKLGFGHYLGYLSCQRQIRLWRRIISTVSIIFRSLPTTYFPVHQLAPRAKLRAYEAQKVPALGPPLQVPSLPPGPLTHK